MTSKQKILWGAAVFLVIYTITGYFILPVVLMQILPQKMSEQLNRRVDIEKISINPYALSVAIENLSINKKEAEERFIFLKKVYVNFEIISLLRRGLIIRELLIEAPKITISRLDDTRFNFSDLIGAEQKTPENEQAKKENGNEQTEKEPAKPFFFAVSNIQMTDGTFIYEDKPFNKTHKISDINWELPIVSNFIQSIDRFSEPLLACNIDGATLTLNLKTKPFKETLETIVDVNFKNIYLPGYMPYASPEQFGVQINQGILSLGMQAGFRKVNGSSRLMIQGDISLENLGIDDNQNRNILTLPELKITVLPSEIMENQLHLGKVALVSPVLSCIRQADGVLNLMAGGEEETVKARKKQAKDEEKIDNKGPGQPLPDKSKRPERAFVLNLDLLELNSGIVRFIDFKAGSGNKSIDTTIRNFNVTIKDFSTQENVEAGFKVGAVLNNRAHIALDGSMTTEPLSLKADIDLSDINLAWCQPYLPENVKLVVSEGLVSASAHADMAKSGKGAPSVSITGKSAVKNLVTVDPDKAESFLKWRDFKLDGIQINTEPPGISVDTISFNDLKNQLIIFPDGKSNVEKIFVQEKAKAKTKAKPKKTSAAPDSIPKKDTTLSVRIGKITMADTEFRFSDRRLSPHYKSLINLKNMAVTGLSSEAFKKAKVDIGGNIDGYAPLSITGAVNPLAKDLFVDLDVKLSDMEMVPVSSYTGKYIGRAIEKGTLSLDLNYLIRKNAIRADNHIFMDQFTLGKAVESPDAMKLPVGLAIALLKDRKGQIDIKMPVTGRMDDPEFKWGGIILTALTNLIMKAATSPFSLVGSLVGGGDELRYIEFDPGLKRINEADQKKLRSLKTLLMERPELKFEIIGYVDTKTDHDALISLALERKIKAPEILAAVKKGETPDPEMIAGIILSPEKRLQAIRTLYQKEILNAEPKNEARKALDDPELTEDSMVRLLKENLSITEADLRLLAMGRARQVKSFLLAEEKELAERLFLKEAKALSSDSAAKFSKSRVELGLDY